MATLAIPVVRMSQLWSFSRLNTLLPLLRHQLVILQVWRSTPPPPLGERGGGQSGRAACPGNPLLQLILYLRMIWLFASRCWSNFFVTGNTLKPVFWCCQMATLAIPVDVPRVKDFPYQSYGESCAWSSDGPIILSSPFSSSRGPFRGHRLRLPVRPRART